MYIHIHLSLHLLIFHRSAQEKYILKIGSYNFLEIYYAFMSCHRSAGIRFWITRLTHRMRNMKSISSQESEKKNDSSFNVNGNEIRHFYFETCPSSKILLFSLIYAFVFDEFLCIDLSDSLHYLSMDVNSESTFSDPPYIPIILSRFDQRTSITRNWTSYIW